MQVAVSCSQLSYALSRSLSVSEKKNPKPIFAFCLINVYGSCLEIMSTDSEVSSKYMVKAKVSGHGMFCVQLKFFADILREMPGNEDLYFEWSEKSHILKLQCQEIHFTLRTSSHTEFPNIKFDQRIHQFKLQSGIISSLINKTYHCLPTDEARPSLNGILLQQTSGKFRAVSTDGHRLALFETQKLDNIENIEPLEDGIIVPKKGIIELKKMSEAYPNTLLDVSLDEGSLNVSYGETQTLCIRLVARDFPNYKAVIPPKMAYRLTCDRTTFLNACKRIKILSSEKTNGLKLFVREDALTLTVNHPALGIALEKINVSYKGQEIEIGLNAKYIIDVLTILSDSEIIIDFNNELGPIIITSPNLPEFMGIIMPLQL
jgi:DNA polymerase-3 subunit beta